MRTGQGTAPAYNVQTAVDAEHALIVAQTVTTEATDNRSLLPMAEAAQSAVVESGGRLNVVADAGSCAATKRSRSKSKFVLLPGTTPGCRPGSRLQPVKQLSYGIVMHISGGRRF